MQLISKYKIENFAYYQNLLLQHIENEIETKSCAWYITGEEGTAIKSDWSRTYSTHPDYKDLVIEMLKTPMRLYLSNFHENVRISLDSMWWTQYETTGTFDWHTHEGANLVAVIQLQLESPLDATKIWGYDETIEEGEIVIFPAMLPHTGAKTIGKRKTTIGLNMQMMIGTGTQGYNRYVKVRRL